MLLEHLVLEVERRDAGLDAEHAAAVGHEAVPVVPVQPVGLPRRDVEPQAAAAASSLKRTPISCFSIAPWPR